MADQWFPIATGALNLASGVVRTPTGERRLTRSEQRLAQVLTARWGATVPRAEVARALWSSSPPAAGRALDAAIVRLRRKLGDDGRNPRILVTVHGIGYRLEPALSPPLSADHVQTSFIGRAQQLEWLAAALSASRAVGVVGPSGAGKTRLVRRALRDRADVAWTSGDWGSRSEGTVALAHALGSAAATENDALEAIRQLDRVASSLLVVDDAGIRGGHALAAIERALTVTSRLRILAISPCNLDLAGERVVWVGPLDDDDATALLIDRARAMAPDFAADPEGVAAAAAIARAADGLPGPIEAIAPLARVLSPSQLLERLTAGRIAHPFVSPITNLLIERLEEPHRELLRRLTVFRAEFSLRDAERMGGEGADVVDTLSRLVGWGLAVRIESESTPWFRLYQATRRAIDLPRDAIYAALCEHRVRTIDVLVGPASVEVDRAYLASLRRWEHDLRCVCDAALERGDVVIAARAALTLDPLAVALGWGLEDQLRRLDAVVGRVEDPLLAAGLLRARGWCRRLLGMLPGAIADTRAAWEMAASAAPDSFLATRAALTCASVLVDAGQIDEAQRLSTLAEASCRDNGWRTLRTIALNGSGLAFDVAGNLPAARARLSEAVAAATQARDGERAAASLVNLAGVLARLGAWDEAEACYRRSEEVDREGAPLRAGAWSLGMGNLALQRGRPAEAIAHYANASAVYSRSGQIRAEGTCALNTGWATLELGDVEAALAHFERALGLARQIGGALPLAWALVGSAIAAHSRGEDAMARAAIGEAVTWAARTQAHRAIATSEAIAWWLVRHRAGAPPESVVRLAETDTASFELVAALTTAAPGGPPASMSSVTARVAWRLIVAGR